MLYVAHCRRDLGMHSREIPDSAITASSAYDQRSVGAANARSQLSIIVIIVKCFNKSCQTQVNMVQNGWKHGQI